MPEISTPLASIIIRTKNEERWIASCLRAVFRQEYPAFEVIIVDNNSSDLTVKRAREFPVSVVHIDKFFPGKAINDGVRAARGDYLVCLSGHCIPATKFWLEQLLSDLSNSDVAGVYGRQEPLPYSSDFDKRDLITVFGLDKKVQIKDSFFHNANSAFTREIWEKFPFDEKVTNIEDRLWGQEVIRSGMKIIYEPEARVYHWHGIHQDLNPVRARRVVKIMESLDGLLPAKTYQSPEELNILAIIPVRGKSPNFGGKTLLDYTIRAAKQSKYIREVIVSTDETETAALAHSLGASAPFIRPKALSEDYVDIVEVLGYTIDQIEIRAATPDLVVILEETYPFRSSGMLDEMIKHFIETGVDTLIAARKEVRGVWMQTEGEITLQGEGFMPRGLKKTQALIGLLGLGCVTYPMFLRQKDLFGGKVGIYEISHPLSAIELRDKASMLLAEKMVNVWWSGV